MSLYYLPVFHFCYFQGGAQKFVPSCRFIFIILMFRPTLYQHEKKNSGRLYQLKVVAMFPNLYFPRFTVIFLVKRGVQFVISEYFSRNDISNERGCNSA